MFNRFSDAILSLNLGLFSCLRSQKVVLAESEKISPLIRVIFLPENHERHEDRLRNAAFLKENYSFTRGDILLVEDDASKSSKELNLEQVLGLNSFKNYYSEGWDSHESCLRRLKIRESIKKILSAVDRLEKGENKEDIDFLNQTMSLVGYEEMFFRQSEKKKFLSTCKVYAEQARDYFAWKEFPERQDSLQKTIHECLARKDFSGCLFVFTGNLHVDSISDKTADYAVKLLSSLNPDSYLILGQNH